MGVDVEGVDGRVDCVRPFQSINALAIAMCRIFIGGAANVDQEVKEWVDACICNGAFDRG
jgi:hypothetical protein